MACAASAQEALYLSWDDCRSPSSGTTDQPFLCDLNDQILDLYCAFRPPIDTGPTVIGIVAILDIQHSDPSLPDWWKMAASGQCRSGALLASADFTQNGGCSDPWRNIAAAEIQEFDIGQPGGSPSQVRILAVAGVPADSARALTADRSWYGVKVRIKTTKTTGGNACAGCLPPACLVLNGIEIRRLAGSPGGDLMVVTPGPDDANRATWRGGAGADCALVPVRAVTWGRIKSLYR